MFITKSEKQSLVETSLNLGDKVLKLESELNAIKAILKKSPSWAWVENLEKRAMVADKRFETSAKNQVKKNTEIMASIKLINEKIDSNKFFIHQVFSEVTSLASKKMDKVPSVVVNTIEDKSTQKPVIAKKRGRPLGSKANRPKFPPKTPFELKKPLGRPKGSKNKPK